MISIFFLSRTSQTAKKHSQRMFVSSKTMAKNHTPITLRLTETKPHALNGCNVDVCFFARISPSADVKIPTQINLWLPWTGLRRFFLVRLWFTGFLFACSVQRRKKKFLSNDIHYSAFAACIIIMIIIKSFFPRMDAPMKTAANRAIN